VPGPGWDGQYETDLAPPDPTGAVGPNSYIELINLRFGIYGRDGSLVSQGTMQDLSALPQTDLSDPQIAWDPSTQRFYYAILDFNTNEIGIGFSKTDNPQGATDFCKYVADYGYGPYYLPDYPKLGFSRDFLLIGVNEFFLQALYTGSDVDWLSKPPAGPLSSCPAPSTFNIGAFYGVTNANGTDASTPVPAVQTDPSGTGWVVAAPDAANGPQSFVTLFPVTNDGSGNAVLGSPKTLSVPPFSVPASATQPGGPTIDTLDGRFERSVSGIDPSHGSVNAVWTAHAVFGGLGSEERWYEINPATSPPTLLQSGKATSASLDVWNGAVSPDRAVNGASTAFGSNMVMGFNTSSTTAYPAIQMVSKVGSDPQSGFVLVQQSPGKNDDFTCYSPYGPPCRWGDYSGASADPAADPAGTTGAVWLSDEWNVASADSSGMDWRTFNWKAVPGAASLPGPTAPTPPQGLTATRGNAVVDLSWSSPASDGGSGIFGYNVYRGTASGGETLLQPGVAGTSFHDSGLTNGRTYYYEVTAVNGVGESAPSNETSATPATVPTAPRSLLAQKAATKGVRLNWSAPTSNGGSPLTAYRIYRSSVLRATVSASTTTYKDTSTTRGTTYCYFVTAMNAVGESPHSNTSCAAAK
jgi:hypothetical protein